MRIRLLFSLIFIITAIKNAEQQNDHNHGTEFDRDIPIPFPQCFNTKLAQSFLRRKVIDHMYDMKIAEENRKLSEERDRNIKLNNCMFKNLFQLINIFLCMNFS